MKKIYVIVSALWILGLFIGVGAAQQGDPAPGNVILNGDYGDDLNNWNFEDTSLYCSSAKADVKDGRARIRLRGLWGRGTLSQDLSEAISPGKFKADYEIRGILHQKIKVILRPEIIYTVETRIGSVINAHMIYYDQRYDYDINDGTRYDKATLEIEFDYVSDKVKLYLDGDLKNTFDLTGQNAPLEVQRVELKMIGHGVLKGNVEEGALEQDTVDGGCLDLDTSDDKCLKKVAFFDNIELYKTDYQHEIPEFSTIAIPIFLILAVMFVFRRKRQNKQ